MAKKAEFSIETVKKYIFWVCIPIGLIVTIVTTVLAVGRIGQAFNAKKNALESQKQAVEKIRTESDHPNEETVKEIDNCTKDLRGRVQQAWRTLEKDQRERNQWPEAVGPEFNEEVSRLKSGDEISIDSLELYLNFVERYLPQLEYDVDRRRIQYLEDGQWKDIDPLKGQHASGGGGDESFNTLSRMGRSTMDGGMGGGMSGGSGGDTSGGTTGYLPKVDEDGKEIERMVGVVDWPNPETRTVVATWQSLPKSNEVWFAQEELWVYAALLSVIKKSNTGATGPHNATVKRIENLLIGQAASMELSSQLKQRIGGGGGGMEGDMMSGGMDGGMSGGMGGGMDGGMGGAMVARTEEEVANMKRHFRYVNELGEPLAHDATPPFAQFNRMPVVLRLIADQRRIPEILVNCANCDMPIDVLRVRINPGASKPFELSAYDPAAGMTGGGEDSMSGGGGGGYGGGGMSGGGAGYGGGGMGGGASSSSGGDEVQVKLDGVGGMYGSNAVPIEIYGCISIFNPVEHGMSAPTEETSAAPEE